VYSIPPVNGRRLWITYGIISEILQPSENKVFNAPFTEVCQYTLENCQRVGIEKYSTVPL
jgi:hypothetical protein